MNAVLASCPSCGGAVVVGDRFCERCGTEFADRVAASANDVGLPNPNPSARSAGHTPETTERSAARPSCVRCQGPVDADAYCIECGLKQPAARDHMELDLGTAAFVCDRGRRHARNEDSAALGARPGRVAAVVCDGVSTAPMSDRASQAAVDAALAELLADGPVADVVARATTAAQTAAAALATPASGVPSCTYVAAVVDDGTLTVAWVGDSRAYLVDAGAARRLTSDDSWAQDTVDAGTMTEAEAMTDPRAHQITRWLGADAVTPVVARTVEIALVGPARLLVCSDGLWNELSADADLLALGTLDDAPLSAARRLVDFANAAGGRDNITVALVDLPWAGPAATSIEGAS